MAHRSTSARNALLAYGAPPCGSHRLRMRLILSSFLAVLACIGGWLIMLQADPDMKFSAEEIAHIGTVDLDIPRGDIRDRNGSLLATDRETRSLWADPRRVKEPSTTALFLSAQFGLDEMMVLKRLAKRDSEGRAKKFAWIKRWLSDEESRAFGEMDKEVGKGLALKTESERLYPEGDLAAHILGFVNREGTGCEGVELAFDSYLKTTPGMHRSRVDGKRKMLRSLTLEYVDPEGGDTIYLSIDKAIQRTLEQALDKGMERAKAPRAMGIVLDPDTGAILALACRPAFDPNAFWDVPPEMYKNRAVVDVFEPGSAFKIVTASAALEHGLITPETLIDCENGAFNPYGHRIKDYHKLGVEPFRTCFAESSNIAIIKVAAMLGPERLETWIRRFGFAETTSEDLRGESRGIFSPCRRWSRLSMGSLPMGQEIAVTILQLARAYCVIANGGSLVDPYLVEAAVGRDGEVVHEHCPAPPKRILSESTAATMADLCHQVVLHGTGDDGSIPEYRVGGKTGTAQIARPNGGGYYEDKYTTIFAGFAPVADPRVCAVIVVQEPAIKLHYGGYVCGPIFKKVVRDALIRLNCPEDPMPNAEEYEDELEPAEEPELEDLDAMLAGLVDADIAIARVEDADTVVARVEEEPLSFARDSEEMMLDSLELIETARAPVAVADGPTLPDLTRKTKREATAALAGLKVAWDLRGAGRVVSQDPAPGTPLRDVSLCRLEFSNRQREEGDETQPHPKTSRS